jgi:hypothetical protein
VRDAEYIKFSDYLKRIIFITHIYLLIYSAFKLYTPYRIKSIFVEAITILNANIIRYLQL